MSATSVCADEVNSKAPPAPGLTEGRAAYEGPGAIDRRRGNDFGPGFNRGASDSPYNWAPTGTAGGFPGTRGRQAGRRRRAPQSRRIARLPQGLSLCGLGVNLH
jgi:hypothetical protein